LFSLIPAHQKQKCESVSKNIEFLWPIKCISTHLLLLLFPVKEVDGAVCNDLYYTCIREEKERLS
jgi:hypothetical protein